MASERLRQRETVKYYQSWLESSVGFDAKPASAHSRYHLDGTQLDSSKDTALTAFAQLGCLKLNIKRGIVALISSTRQYILAEATRSISLVTDRGTGDPDDEIWFGNASIPRSQGISASALTPSEYTAQSNDGDSFTAPALVINDITKHPEFSQRAYAGNGVRFYCGVPLVTADGSSIGVYTLSDDKPRHGLHPNELRFLCDMATVVMRHLESIKNEAARFRGETMVLGLGQFVQGASTISSHKSFRRRLPSPQAQSDTTATRDTTPDRQFKGMTITAADPSALRSVALSEAPPEYRVVAPKQEDPGGKDVEGVPQNVEASEVQPRTHSDSDRSQDKPRNGRQTVENVFSRAANVLRECCGADGVLFFDAVSTNLARRASPTAFRSANRNPVRGSGEDETKYLKRESSSDSRSATADSEDMDSNDEDAKTCNLLGFSMDVTEQSQSNAQALKGLTVTEGTIRRLIRRYPQGKIFFFSPDGTTSSSETEATLSGTTSDTSATTAMADSLGQESSSFRGKKPKATFADELKRLVPQAQSVIWLPMWDFSKQRWSAGAFLWTRMAEQLIVAQDDLVYLKTFANSIMIEVARHDAAFADDTKATFIANISHELRSPLHGVIGSCELLKDTSMDEYQASLVKAIELCGKTLNDTVDHVLDYTKINQVIKRGGHLNTSATSKLEHDDDPPHLPSDRPSLEDDFDLAALVEDTVEAVWTSRSSQHQRLRRQSAEADNLSSEAIDPKDVNVIIKLAHQDDWWVRSQPGAIKRILTNLVQNSLKYTDRGTVTIALTTRGASTKRNRHKPNESALDQDHNFTISVVDTGRGMSNDFVRNHAFTPFSQESSFSDGTGLGLSIVQLIVDSLGGKIELKSKPGLGTEIKVHLGLPRSKPSVQRPYESDSRLEIAKIQGKSICVVHSVEDHPGNETNKRRAFEAALKHTLAVWFGIIPTKSTNFRSVKADFYICTSIPKAPEISHMIDSGSFPTTCCLILLVSTAIEKLELRKSLDSKEKHGLIIEIAVHPLGPHKLRGILTKCLSRRLQLLSTLPSLAATSEGEVGSATPGEVLAHRHEKALNEDETGGEDIPNIPGSNKPRSGGTSQPRESLARHSPRTSTSSSEAKPEIHKRTATKPVDPGKPTPSLTRVLLVDDNAINLNILKAAMKKAKLPFETANDGLEALEAFKRAALAESDDERPFTHILMDISMPVMDGIESTRLIRRFEKDRRERYRNKTSKRQSAWSDYGPATVEDSEAFTGVGATQDEDDNLDEDGEISDVTGSLPMSPAEQTEPEPFSFQSNHRARPILSHNQAGEPIRAMTYSVGNMASPISLYKPVDMEKHRRVMIIALSGVAFEQTQRDMYEAGADMFFAKPVKLKELALLLNEDRE